MSYKIIVDSCCELPEKYLTDSRFERIPLGLEVGDYHTMDDESFDQADFLKRVAASSVCPKSSCPSPERFRDACEGEAEHIYMVTLSSQLSGSYNSAVLGKRLYGEKGDGKKIHVVDSRSASGGEAQIALKAMELEEKGIPFDDIVKQLEAFRDELNTYFVLDNLETLRKNGRLTGVKALVVSTLNIKPVMGATDEGTIYQRGQAIGINKALQKMVEVIVKETKNAAQKRLVITFCNCKERAEYVRSLLIAKQAFLEVILMETAGISSMYANDGGIIVAV